MPEASSEFIAKSGVHVRVWLRLLTAIRSLALIFLYVAQLRTILYLYSTASESIPPSIVIMIHKTEFFFVY